MKASVAVAMVNGFINVPVVVLNISKCYKILVALVSIKYELLCVNVPGFNALTI